MDVIDWLRLVQVGNYVPNSSVALPLLHLFLGYFAAGSWRKISSKLIGKPTTSFLCLFEPMPWSWTFQTYDDLWHPCSQIHAAPKWLHRFQWQENQSDSRKREFSCHQRSCEWLSALGIDLPNLSLCIVPSILWFHWWWRDSWGRCGDSEHIGTSAEFHVGALFPCNFFTLSCVTTLQSLLVIVCRYEITRPPDEKWGSKELDGSWNGMVGMVNRSVSRKSDAIILWYCFYVWWILCCFLPRKLTWQSLGSPSQLHGPPL